MVMMIVVAAFVMTTITEADVLVQLNDDDDVE